MSVLSHLIGKIPLVGHAINQVGKVLPSGGQLVGGALLPGVGGLIGGAIDGNTTPLQKNIGAGVDAAAAGIGGAGLLGLGPAAGAAADGGAPISLGSLLGGIPGAVKAGAGFLGDHPGLVDTGLGAAAALNAANLSKQSTQYAKNAMDTANQSYGDRAPLRLAGVAGMLNPKLSSNTAGLGQIAARGNPFANKPLPLSQVG